LEEIGFDGFRYDMVKVTAVGWFESIQELRALRGGLQLQNRTRSANAGTVNVQLVIGSMKPIAWSDNPVGAFDFPLRWAALRDLCDSYGF